MARKSLLGTARVLLAATCSVKYAGPIFNREMPSATASP